MLIGRGVRGLWDYAPVVTSATTVLTCFLKAQPLLSLEQPVRPLPRPISMVPATGAVPASAYPIDYDMVFG